MKAQRSILVVAIVANVLGWALPVVDDYRGWQAFRVALSPLWPFENFHIEPGPLLVLSVASALTNIVFVGLTVALLRGAGPKLVLWAATAVTLLNLHWPISMGEQRAELESGYFIWVCSFALLALAAFFDTRSARR